MVSSDDTSADRYKQQATQVVLITMMLAFTGSFLGVIFGIVLGDIRPPESWVIALCVVVVGGLLILFLLRPAMATGVITASLSVFFVFYLNLGAILAYTASPEITRIVPYISWFFAVVLIHEFTNFGFYKRAIGLLVSIGPVPIAVFVLSHSTSSLAVEDAGVMVAYMVSFFAFVLFLGFYTRHRDKEVLRAAMADEAERIAAVLRVSEERFRLLGLATRDLVWDADLKSGKMWWNDTLFDRYGYDPEAFDNDMSAWESWIHPDDRERVTESLQSVIENNRSNWTSEYRFVCRDGRTVDVVDRGLVLRDDSDIPVRVIGSTTDVTELRALERKLRHSQKLEAVGQLTGGIAHDFNNLLTIIVGSAETLVDINASDPKAKRLAEVTLQAAERGATLTSHLLSFARRQALAPEYLDPGKILTGLEGFISRTIKEDIDIEISVADDAWPIEVDPGQLENAILNLVINARDAMPNGGRLTIGVSNVTLIADDQFRAEEIKEGRYVRISVTDNGCGIPSDVAERVFEPFFTTKEVGKGSGLGLSMVWGFVQQSNGLARIYSEPGEGTSVKLYFPAADKKETQKPVAVTSAELTPGTERILVVEDDDMVRGHVVAQLRSLGYDCKEAASAADALEIMDKGCTIDLLFTDVVMPGGMNGRQLADAALLRQPDLKVLFTSGYTEDAIIHQGRLDPGVTLLSKPYRRADLAAKIKSALSA